MTAFSYRGAWDGSGRLDVDERMRERVHLSVARSPLLTVVVFGRLLDRPSTAGPGGSAQAVLTDAEFAAARFATSGLDWLAVANGDFSVFVHDHVNQRVHVARNAAGTRPIYFRATPDMVAVASDFAGLDAEPPTGEELNALADPMAVGQFLVQAQSPPDRTIRNDIRTVPAAHRAVLGPDGTRTERSWFPETSRLTRAHLTLDEAAMELRHLLAIVIGEAALAERGPVAVHISGGLDSSAVATMATSALRAADRAAPLAYSWQPDPGEDQPSFDQQLVSAVADRLELDCAWRSGGGQRLLTSLLFDPLAEPITSTSALERPILEDAAGRGVCTIMSGWGGDEVVSFSGRHHRRHRARAVASRLLEPFRQRTRRSLKLRQSPRPHGFASAEIAPLISRTPWETMFQELGTAFDSQCWYLDSNVVIERTDAWSVAGALHGVQYSYPLLDRRVLDFALSLGEHCYPRRRVLMRRALAGLVPESVRLNSDGSDASGVRAQFTDLAVARDLLVAPVERPGVEPTRSRFVDIDALCVALSVSPVPPNPGKVLNALQLLLAPDGGVALSRDSSGMICFSS